MFWLQVQGQPLMVQVSGGQLITSSGQPIMVQAMSGGQGQTIMQVPVSGAQGLQQVNNCFDLISVEYVWEIRWDSTLLIANWETTPVAALKNIPKNLKINYTVVSKSKHTIYKWKSWKGDYVPFVCNFAYQPLGLFVCLLVLHVKIHWQTFFVFTLKYSRLSHDAKRFQ